MAKSVPVGVDPVSCCDTAHGYCCNCVDKLKSIRDKVTPDVQTVIDQCIEDCRKCYDELATVNPPLAAKRP